MFRNVFILVVAMAICAFAQGTFTDSRNGKKYKTVTIGKQIWMAQNLDYAGEDGDIGTCSGNDPANCQKYGRLYDWENAMLSCPDGWHLPDNNEWQTLADFAGGRETAGRKLKARNGWEKWDCEWTDMDDRGRMTKFSKCNSDNYGFSALPSSSEGNYGYWWTASENYSDANVVWMQYNSEDIFQGNDSKSTASAVQGNGSKSTFSAYSLMKDKNFAKDIDRVLKNVAGLSVSGGSKSKAYNVRCLKGKVELPSKLVAKRAAVAAAEQAKKAEKAAEIANPLTTEVTDEGTILRGSTLARKLAWLDRSAESHNTYIIEVNANENIAPHTFEYKGAINITIILRGDDENRTLRLKSHGIMFVVRPNVTLILDNNITLQGHSGNTDCMIWVHNGTLKMNIGSAIIGNTRVTSNSGGAGVHVSGTFEMNGGTISENTVATIGGGVYVSGTFTMNDGTISSNTSNKNGGGVYVDGTFTMRGGTIEDNISNQGGGVYRGSSGSFNMSGGTITRNIAREYGGGVRVEGGWGVTFAKTGGTITGYNSDYDDGNVVKDDNGVIARRGHTVYVDEKRRKETTAGQWTNLSTNDEKVGGWDD
jgi:uncharacterized protein (TIGR02145 family)